MSYNKWPKRSAEKNYFMVPNEIFSIGLDYREISRKSRPMLNISFGTIK